jgi:hypothetical protein
VATGIDPARPVSRGTRWRRGGVDRLAGRAPCFGVPLAREAGHRLTGVRLFGARLGGGRADRTPDDIGPRAGPIPVGASSGRGRSLREDRHDSCPLEFGVSRRPLRSCRPLSLPVARQLTRPRGGPRMSPRLGVSASRQARHDSRVGDARPAARSPRGAVPRGSRAARRPSQLSLGHGTGPGELAIRTFRDLASPTRRAGRGGRGPIALRPHDAAWFTRLSR